jgi:hypothetical protein
MSARPRRRAQRQANQPPPAAIAAVAAATAAPAGPPTPWHDFLTGELGFSAVAATCSIETTQGYNGLDTLEDLTVRSITDLCETMRKDRANPIPVIQPAEYGLIHTLYYVKGMMYCSRTYTIAGCTRDVRKSWAGFWENMKSYKEPTTDMPDRKDFTDNWVRTFEILDEYLTRLIGNKCMVPLYYVVRKEADVVPEANDPPTNYTSCWSEMCARMPHYTTRTVGVRTPVPTYEEDNRKVWDKLATIFNTSDDYTYMRPFQRERDGRAAYKALYDHFLGPNNTDNMATKADAEMKLKYTGEKRRHNFETYVNAHKQLHNVYEDLKRHGYEGLSTNTKVRRFLEGFETPTMTNCYNQILSTPALRRNFDDAVSYCTNYIKQAKHIQTAGDPGVQIGASGTAPPAARGNTNGNNNNTGKSKSNINWDTSNVNVELRHYTSDEYKKLTDSEKLKLKRLQAGGHTEQELRTKMMNPNDPPIMKKVIAAMQSGKPSAQKGKPSKGMLKNRNNKALVKQVTTTKDSNDSEAWRVAPVYVGIQHAGLQDGSDTGYLELDSHADIAVLGANCRIFQETEWSVDVYGYDPSHGLTSRKIVSGVFAYDNPEDGICTLLIVHQGLHVPTMNSSLIPPYQMQAETQLSSKLDLEEHRVHTLQIYDQDATAISSATHARSAWAHHGVDTLLAKAMAANCYVSSVYASNLKTSGGLTAEQLARNWMIPIAKA